MQRYIPPLLPRTQDYPRFAESSFTLPPPHEKKASDDNDVERLTQMIRLVSISDT